MVRFTKIHDYQLLLNQGGKEIIANTKAKDCTEAKVKAVAEYPYSDVIYCAVNKLSEIIAEAR